MVRLFQTFQILLDRMNQILIRKQVISHTQKKKMDPPLLSQCKLCVKFLLGPSASCDFFTVWPLCQIGVKAWCFCSLFPHILYICTCSYSALCDNFLQFYKFNFSYSLTSSAVLNANYDHCSKRCQLSCLDTFCPTGSACQ